MRSPWRPAALSAPCSPSPVACQPAHNASKLAPSTPAQQEPVVTPPPPLIPPSDQRSAEGGTAARAPGMADGWCARQGHSYLLGVLALLSLLLFFRQ